MPTCIAARGAGGSSESTLPPSCAPVPQRRRCSPASQPISTVTNDMHNRTDTTRRTPCRALALAALALVGIACSPAVGEHQRDEPVSAPTAPPPVTAPTTSASAAASPKSYANYEATESSEVRSWVAKQNAQTRETLDASPSRADFAKGLAKHIDVAYITPPTQTKRFYYYKTKTPGKDHSVLVRARKVGVNEQIVLDPNTWSADGTANLSGWTISHSERYLAYGTTEGGSDWTYWRVLDLQTLKPLKDKLRGLKWSGPAWAPGDVGLFYSGYEDRSHSESAPGTGNRLYYHKLGTKQAGDPEVYVPKDPKWMVAVDVFESQDLAEVYLYKSSDGKGRVELFPLSKDWAQNPKQLFAKPSQHTLSPEFGWRQWVVGGRRGTVYLFSEQDAPLGKLVRYSLKTKKLTTIVKESDKTLVSARMVGKHLVAEYVSDVKSHLEVFDTDGKRVDTIRMDFPANIWGIGGARSWAKHAFFGAEGYATPGSIYRYTFATKKRTKIWSLKTDFKATDYVAEQAFYPADDGTKIPVFVVHKKGMKLDGTNRTMLYGYGCYGYLLSISFSGGRVPWLERGGVYAVANIRGGGAYGSAWHRAAQAERKQTSIDDFIAGARWLIDRKYTSSKHLSIRGASCGGLLTGATVTQRPELFGAALVEVGVLDLLRFHKFSGAYLWEDELGSPDNPKQLPVLKKISPLLRAQNKRAYPAMLVTTRKKDTRVSPMNSYKFAAALQEHQTGDDPILLRVDETGGHGLGSLPLKARIAYLADVYSFAWDHTR